MKHLFVINPAAGGKKGRPDETQREVRRVSEGLAAPCEIYITKAPKDACAKIAAEAAREDELRVYACGGDGTLNECVNGVAGCPNAAITHYPCGTGNDFIKMFGKNDAEKFRDLDALTRGVTRRLDLIECNGRYGVNICSVGIDARIGADVHKYSSFPIIGGKTAYLASLAVNVVKGVKRPFRITAGGRTLEGDFSLICACNGQFYGGGFNPVPDAAPDDGLLDFLIVSGVSRLKLIRVVGKFAKGQFRELGGLIQYMRGSYMEIEGKSPFIVNIDGESIFTMQVYFKMIPNGINFIFPEKMEYFQSRPQILGEIERK